MTNATPTPTSERLFDRADYETAAKAAIAAMTEVRASGWPEDDHARAQHDEAMELLSIMNTTREELNAHFSRYEGPRKITYAITRGWGIYYLDRPDLGLLHGVDAASVKGAVAIAHGGDREPTYTHFTRDDLA